MRKLNQILILLFFSSHVFSQNNLFKLGSESLITNLNNKLTNKNIALVINQTSVLQNGTFLLDTLLSLNLSVKKIFSLEHGFKGNYQEGENINSTNSQLGIPIVSLYGKEKTPSKEDLKNIDLLIYDIQDVGVRFYTYISSLNKIMISVAENNKEIFVLDRPNPITANKISGEILDLEFSSFVGISQIPIQYGMTIGELSLFFKNKIEKSTQKEVNLRVIKMENYNRTQFFDFYLEKWISPSPNLKSLDAALLYPGLCFLEATNISEGRGTEFPFEQFGAPFLETQKLISELKTIDLNNSFEFIPVIFSPKTESRIQVKNQDQKYFGIRIKIKNRKFDSVEFGIGLLKILFDNYNDKIEFNFDWLSKLYGNRNLEKYLKHEISGKTFYEKLANDKKIFKEIRKEFLLY